MTLSKLECPTPTVSIDNFKIIGGVASCDITFDAGAGSAGNIMQSALQRYNGASWNTNIELLYHAFQEGSGGTFHVEWEMVQAGDCVVAVNIANMCGERSGFKRSDLSWNGEAGVSPGPGGVCAEGAKRGKMTCWNGTVIHGEVCRGNKWVTSGEFCPPKPECTEGDKKPGEICRDGDWVPYTPAGPVPGEGRLYVKFDIPWLDMLPGIPYEPWMWIPPGFEIVEG